MAERLSVIIIAIMCCSGLYPLLAESTDAEDFECRKEVYRHRVVLALKEEFIRTPGLVEGKIGWTELDTIVESEGALSICHQPSDFPNSSLNRTYVFQFPLGTDIKNVVDRFVLDEKVDFAEIDSLGSGNIVAIKSAITFPCRPDITQLKTMFTAIKSQSWGELKFTSARSRSLP